MSKLNSDAFWSACKRKSIPEILETVFTEMGYEEAAEVAKNTTRFTDLAMRKMRDALPASEEVEVEEEPTLNEDEVETPEEDPSELTYADEDAELIVLENKVRKAIKKGDYKKAKKALKKFMATGITGTEVDKLKKAVKDMK